LELEVEVDAPPQPKRNIVTANNKIRIEIRQIREDLTKEKVARNIETAPEFEITIRDGALFAGYDARRRGRYVLRCCG
jgi:hypothetical protein